MVEVHENGRRELISGYQAIRESQYDRGSPLLAVRSLQSLHHFPHLVQGVDVLGVTRPTVGPVLEIAVVDLGRKFPGHFNPDGLGHHDAEAVVGVCRVCDLQ